MWAHISCDLRDVYGIEVWDRDLMGRMPWMWLRERIDGLLSRPASYVTAGDRVVSVYTTRIQTAVAPPPEDRPAWAHNQ